jgi:hypothetical protein
MVDEEYNADAEDIYNDEGREQKVEDDEMSPDEEGFIEGYEEGTNAVCATCDAVLDADNTIERTIDGDIKSFCSDECAEKYLKKEE